jgi:SAM-dependent methyltransferase
MIFKRQPRSTAAFTQLGAGHWSLLRLGKVSDGNLRFARFSSPAFCEAGCPVCGKITRQEESYIIGASIFYRCIVCDTHVSPSLGEYAVTEIRDPFAVQFDISRSAKIGEYITFPLQITASRPSGSYLEIGCGFGFGVDAVRLLRGWTAVGWDSSVPTRETGEWLGCHIATQQWSEWTTRTKQTFDVIFCRGQLEIASDPVAYLKSVANLLSPAGELFIVVPSAKSVYDMDRSMDALALLPSSGPCFFPTTNGLQVALQKAGLAGATIVECNGRLLVHWRPSTRGSVAPRLMNMNVDTTETAKAETNYLTSLAADGSARASTAAAARLYCQLSDMGLWDQMTLKLPIVEDMLEDFTSNIREFEQAKSTDFAAKAAQPVAARLFYSHAMYLLNHLEDHTGAASAFALAARFARKLCQIDHGRFGIEADTYGASKYHELLCRIRTNDRRKYAAALKTTDRDLMGLHWLDRTLKLEQAEQEADI